MKLITSLVLALIASLTLALASSAAAGEVAWTGDYDPEEEKVATLPGAEDQTHITGAGPIAWTWFNIIHGPCETDSTGAIWNGSEMGEGAITGFTISGPCATNIPGCTVTAVHSSASEESPWPITLTETDTVDISNITYTSTYTGANCAVAGLPPQVSITGTAVGKLQNSETEDGRMSVCINLNFYSDPALTVEFEGEHTSLPISVNLTGIFCIDREEADLTFEHSEEE